MSQVTEADKRMVQTFSSILTQISEMVAVIKIIVERQERFTNQTAQLLEEIGKIRADLQKIK